MFAYVDPQIKERLIADGKLVTIGEHGRRCAPDDRDYPPFISIVGPVPMPIHLARGKETFRWYAWVRNTELDRIEDVVLDVRRYGPSQLFGLLSNHMAVNSVLMFGDFEKASQPLVRVHSNCLTGDVFGSMRCDCGPQLHETLERIVADGAGALIYMAGHEGRGIGLWAKAITYLLQDAGEDTYQANESLGLPTDSRDFSDAGRILRHFRAEDLAIRLLGNNPLKRQGLEALGIEVVAQEPLIVGVNEHNQRYLTAKRSHGHRIPEEALTGKEE